MVVEVCFLGFVEGVAVASKLELGLGPHQPFPIFPMWGFLKLGVPFWGPHNEDYGYGYRPSAI